MPQPAVVLVAFREDGSRRDLPLEPGTYTLGRDNASDVRIPTAAVSRKHCVLHISEVGEVRVRDLDSSNGTFRNERRVEESELIAGDHLRLGDTTLTVQINGMPADIQPPAAEDESLMDTSPGTNAPSLTDDDSSLFDFDFNDDEP